MSLSQGWMRSLPVEERPRPTGEWNHYRVESRDGKVTLAVNGKVVSGGTACNPRKGYICLKSEGSEVHFRNIRIHELPSSYPEPDEVATLEQGFARHSCRGPIALQDDHGENNTFQFANLFIKELE